MWRDPYQSTKDAARPLCIQKCSFLSAAPKAAFGLGYGAMDTKYAVAAMVLEVWVRLAR